MTVASAIDSPSCGMMMGICGILRPQKISRRFDNRARGWSMHGPEIGMIRHGGVLRVQTLWRSVEHSERFGGNPRNYLRRDAAPRPRFADAKQSACARDGCDHRVRGERFHRAQINDFNFPTFTAKFFS